MAKLTKMARAKLPGKVFAGPKRSFPIPDKAHAKAAIMLAPKAEAAGSISAGQKASIVAQPNYHLDIVASENRRIDKSAVPESGPERRSDLSRPARAPAT